MLGLGSSLHKPSGLVSSPQGQSSGFPSTHYGNFSFIRDTNPTNQTPPSSNFNDFMFVVQSSYNGTGNGLDPSDPDSKILVYDIASNAANPSFFSFTPPTSDIPDFKNANEILINGDDIFVTYRWQNPKSNRLNPSKLAKFTNVSIDFSTSSFTYDSVETVELFARGCHSITRDGSHAYFSYRPRESGSSDYTFESSISKVPLTGTLSVTHHSPLDGGLTTNGTSQEWYGNLHDGTFDLFNGTDYLGADDIVCHGDYLYFPIYAMSTTPNTLYTDSTRTFINGIGRVPTSNVSGQVEVLYLFDPSSFSPVSPINMTPHTQVVAKDSYLYVFSSKASGSLILVKIDLEDPRNITESMISSTISGSSNGASDSGRAHAMELYGDKIIVTTSLGSFIGVYNQSDLSEVGHVHVAETDSDLVGVGATDDLAVIGNYAYVAFESDDPSKNKIYSLDLTNISSSGLTLIDTMSTQVYSLTHSQMIV